MEYGDENDEYGSDEDFGSDQADFSDDDDGGRMFMDEETKTQFTNYSVSSSVMRRNEGLTLLDDRFEKVNFNEGLTLLDDRFEKVSKYSLLNTIVLCNEKWRSDNAGW